MEIYSPDVSQRLHESLSALPVAYRCGDKGYHGFAEDFVLTDTTVTQDTDTLRVTRLTGLLRASLTVTVQLTDYPAYGAFMWQVRFENQTDKDAPAIASADALAITLAGTAPVLSGIYGDGGLENRGPYAPYEFRMSGFGAKPVHMEPETGRGTYHYFPYFHLTTKEGGFFAALAWPILWKADFVPAQADGRAAVEIHMGQAHLDTILHPGECIVLPSVTILPHGAMCADDATNLWRHFMMDCILRKPYGKPFPPHLSGGTSWMYDEMKDATDDNQIAAMEAYLDHGIPIDYWWMDAGWYYRTGEESLSTWLDTGTWMVDKHRFPSEFSDISDFGAAHGVQTLLWFEPEMARLDPGDHDDRWGVPRQFQLLGSPLVDMGDPAFVRWAFERFSSILDKGKISLYRQDYGINPAPVFLALNTEGRVGYTENRYVQGYYALWDLLIRRYPDMMIDDCAAGGGRNDLDSMRRAVPLHKTDHDYDDQEDKQSMHWGLFAWLPYFGTCMMGPGRADLVTPYIAQSNFAPWTALGLRIDSPNLDWDTLKTYMDIRAEVAPFFTADYYQLTAWSRGDRAWRGWEFYDPDKGEGFFQMFRPAHAAEAARSVVLKGLEADASYELCDLVTRKTVILPASVLLHEGWRLTLDTTSAVTVRIRRC